MGYIFSSDCYCFFGAFLTIVIISGFIFSKKRGLVLTAIVAIAAKLLLAIRGLDLAAATGPYDGVLGIGMVVGGVFTGLLITKMATANKTRAQYRITFQKMVSDILFESVSLTQENMDLKVNYLLERVGRFFDVDRTYLFTINHQHNTMTYSNEWCNTGIGEEIWTIEETPLDVFPWWIDQLDRNKLVYIEDVGCMPKEARKEQKQLQRQGVKSLISVPVMVEGKMQAFIGIDSVVGAKKWSKEKIEMLNIMANILSSGMTQLETHKEIKFMAYYDSLTKLPNRFLFEERVGQAICLSKKTKKCMAVIFINLDNFKTVNDTIGHKGGDDLLRQVAQSLIGLVGKKDTVARFGGDEFMIMLSNISDDHGVFYVADKVMKLFSDLFIVSGQEFIITASAGIAIYPTDGLDPETLVKNADIAMSEAKARGKNKYAFCTEAIKNQVQIRMALSNDLYHAAERNELTIYYQPQISIATNEIVGAEALLRWKHPVRGMMFPGVFIPIAEENNLINGIGQWVLKAACIQNKKWQDMGLAHIVMAVNLSAAQIISPKLVENIEKVFKETRLDPKYIELEITESVAAQDTDYVTGALNKLKELGVSIAIDDFGTEYSSLSRLKVLPIDRIKIDMQFVQGIEGSEKDRAITMIIINLAKSLGLNVVAEGVETASQLAFLEEKKCDCMQGYYCYKPMPAEEMEALLLSC